MIPKSNYQICKSFQDAEALGNAACKSEARKVDLSVGLAVDGQQLAHEHATKFVFVLENDLTKARRHLFCALLALAYMRLSRSSMCRLRKVSTRVRTP